MVVTLNKYFWQVFDIFFYEGTGKPAYRSSDPELKNNILACILTDTVTCRTAITAKNAK